MKTALLISGGWDSVACYYLNKKKKLDLLFINYNQNYYDNEIKVLTNLMVSERREFKIINLNLYHDIERRNFYFITELKKLGYKKIIIGSRNILPVFDKYKDSNYLSLKLFGYLMGIKIALPVCGWSKKKVVEFVKTKTDVIPYNCYNNLNDINNCSCVNCIEIKGIL